MSALHEDDLHEDPEDLTKQTAILNQYCFWYHKRHQKIGASAYEESITQIASFQTIEHFWRVYDHMIRVNDVKSTTDFHLFKQGIKPTWEDPQNEKGGKWMIRLKKGLSSRYWEDIVLAIIGEQFDVGHEICGAVISVRAAEDILSVWNKNSDNLEAKNKIRDQMKKILRLPTYVPLEYKVHRDSLTDGSSFRNTSVWRPSHAPRGASWNGPEGSAEGTTASQKPYHSSHRSHTAQPPGGVVGDGTSWGGAPNSRPRQHQSSWKSSLSADTGHSGDGNAVPSPIVTSLGDAVVGERRGWARDATLPSGSSSWGRPSPATTPVGGGFQHKGPDDERGGNYGEFMEGRSQKPSRFQGSGIVGVEVAGFQPRRRFENAPAAPPADDTRKKPATASNSADQVRVWGRAQTIVADAPVAPS